MVTHIFGKDNDFIRLSYKSYFFYQTIIFFDIVNSGGKVSHHTSLRVFESFDS